MDLRRLTDETVARKNTEMEEGNFRTRLLAKDSTELIGLKMRPVTLEVKSTKDRLARSREDCENAIKLHMALPHLSRLLDSDMNFWSCLALEPMLRDYMKRRFPIPSVDKAEFDPELDGPMSDEKRLYMVRCRRWFCALLDLQTEGAMRLITRHGLGRLWWAAEVTHIPKPKAVDPYGLTKVFFRDTDLYRGLIERNAFREPNILQGFLMFLDNQRPEDRAHRFIIKWVNEQWVFRNLAGFTPDELSTMFGQQLKRIKRARKAGKLLEAA